MQISAPLLLQLGAVLTALALLGTVARRFALSPIPVYLLAGLALGNGGVAPVTTAGQFITTGAPIRVVLRPAGRRGHRDLEALGGAA